MTKRLIALLFIIISLPGFSQSEIPMADAMRSSGKIYVVVGVLVIIFVGIAVYLWTMDKRLTKIEKDSK